MLLTRIPFFREVIVGSFSCDHCAFTDTEINSAGRIQDKGVRIALQVSAQSVRFYSCEASVKNKRQSTKFVMEEHR